jgi:hypothetical protein
MKEQEWLRLANRLAERVPLALRGDLVFVARAAHELFRCEGHIAAYLSLRRWESGIPGRDADGLLQACEMQQGEILACLAQLLPLGPDRPTLEIAAPVLFGLLVIRRTLFKRNPICGFEDDRLRGRAGPHIRRFDELHDEKRPSIWHRHYMLWPAWIVDST